MKTTKLCMSLSMILIGGFLYSQTISTGVVNLSSTSGLEMTAKIDISTTDVTLTLTGPDDRWLGLSLNGTTMLSSADVVIYDGSNLTDRFFNNAQNIPSTDTQDWNISSDVPISGVRTIVATRSLSGSDGTDHTFSNTDTSINFVWARGNGATFALGWHGSNKGFAANISYSTLSIEEQSISKFTIYPNPSTDYINIGLPSGFLKAHVEVYNYLGAKMLSRTVSRIENKLPMNNLASGVYLVKLKSEGKSYTKKFIIQ